MMHFHIIRYDTIYYHKVTYHKRQYCIVLWSSIHYHTLACSTIKNHRVPYTILYNINYHVLPYNTKLYHILPYILFNIIQYHIVTYNTIQLLYIRDFHWISGPFSLVLLLTWFFYGIGRFRWVLCVWRGGLSVMYTQTNMYTDRKKDISKIMKNFVRFWQTHHLVLPFNIP